jgi:hypothetical protein
MKYLCLAFGDDKDWKLLSRSEKDARLAVDAMLRERGDVVASVEPDVITVRTPADTPVTSDGGFASAPAKLAGFYIIEAENVEEAVKLVGGTPCPRTGGAVEVRPLLEAGNLR